MDKNLNVKIKSRRDTSANWTTANPVLLNGEIILVDTDSGELRAKIGDGTKTYTQLPFSDEALRTLINSKAGTSDIPLASTALPKENGTASAGTSNNYARADHVHPASPASGGHADTATTATSAETANSATTAETANTANSATTAGKLASPVNISLSGAVTGTATAFDGSSNITIPTTGLNASMLNSGTVPSGRLPSNVFDAYGSASAVQSALAADIAGKVDKVDGKGLSANDYTTTEKNKLAGIAAGAEVNVNADWNASSGDAQILNKPTIPSQLSQLTGDATHRTVTDTEKTAWNNKSDFSGSYNDLTNKPTIPNALADLASDATHRTVTDTEKSAWNGKYIKPSGGIPASDLSSNVQSSLDNADSALEGLSGKVDKITGKGLSTNDYTTAEKNKLAGIAAGAEVNQNAFSNIKVGSTTVAADAKQDTVEFVAGSNITLTPDATNDKITISANAGGSTVTTGTPTNETILKVNLDAVVPRMPEFIYGTAVTGSGVGISASVSGAQAGDNYINTETGFIYQARMSGSSLVWDYKYTIAGSADLIADDWLSSKSYAVGDYCIYLSKLWKCKTAHSGRTPAEGTYWTQVTVGGELGKVKVVKLWENASPASSFAAQTINIDLTPYQKIEIRVAYVPSADDKQTFISSGRIYEWGCGMIILGLQSGSAITKRQVILNAGSMQFSTANLWYVGGESTNKTDFCIPLEIYGIKEV